MEDQPKLPRRIWQRDPDKPARWRTVVCVSPPNRFGNPFVSTSSLTSAEEFRYWLTAFVRPQLDVPGMRRRRLQILLDLHQLQGRPLSCTCRKNQVCHAKFLIRLSNRQLDFARILARRALWVPPDAESIALQYRHLGAMPQCVAALACCHTGAIVDAFRKNDRFSGGAIQRVFKKLFGRRAKRCATQTQFKLPKYGIAIIEPIATNFARSTLKVGPPMVCATAWDGETRYMYDFDLGHGNGAWVTWADWRLKILDPLCQAFRKASRMNISSWRVRKSMLLEHPEHVRILIGESKRQRIKMRWHTTTPVTMPSPLTDPQTAARYGIILSPEDCHAKTTSTTDNAASDLGCPDSGRELPETAASWDNYPCSSDQPRRPD